MLEHTVEVFAGATSEEACIVRRSLGTCDAVTFAVQHDGRHGDFGLTGAATIDGIAAREACSKRNVNMTISLAFPTPNLVKAAVEGWLPHGIGVAPFVRRAGRLVAPTPDARTQDLNARRLARRSQVIPSAIRIGSVQLVANGGSPYQDGAGANAELTFVKDVECNSRPFGFPNIATLRIPG
jgi:hypothetical protein